MKYYYLLILFAAFSPGPANMFAQDTLKTQAYEWTTELNVNLFQGELKLNNAIDQIKLRYFLSENLAFRTAFDFSTGRIEDGAANNYGTNPFSSNSIKKKTSAGLNIGLERHFHGTRRLSPYLGGELGFAYKKVSQIIEESDRTYTVDGAWVMRNSNLPGSFSYSFTQFQERGFFAAGCNLIAGFDFYFSEKIFIGYEMSYNFSYMVYPTLSVTEEYISGSGSGSNFPDIDGNEFQVRPVLLNGIRLGFVF